MLCVRTKLCTQFSEGKEGRRGEGAAGRVFKVLAKVMLLQSTDLQHKGVDPRLTVKASSLVTLQAPLHLCKDTLRVEVLVIKHKASHAEDMLFTTAASWCCEYIKALQLTNEQSQEVVCVRPNFCHCSFVYSTLSDMFFVRTKLCIQFSRRRREARGGG